MALFNRARPTPSSADQSSDQPAIFGAWRDGRFEFDSPEAQKAWHHVAYNQGIDPETWHLGREMDERTETVVAAGLGGSLPPTYRGPDGKMRFGSDKTVERPAIRAIRQRAFTGQKVEDIEHAYLEKRVLPGSIEAVAHLLGRNPALSRHARATMPANSNVEMARMMIEPVDSTVETHTQAGDIGPKYKAAPDLLVAQADTNQQNDAIVDVVEPLRPETDRWRDEWREAGIPPHIGWQSAYPGNAVERVYTGQRKAIGKEAAAAEASVRHTLRANYWPVDGKKDDKGRHVLNARDAGRQGDGRYGMTRDGGRRPHHGIDIAAEVDDPVYAVKDGVVVHIVNNVPGYAQGSFGNEVVILHDDGTYTQYAHLEPAQDAQNSRLQDKHGKDRVLLKTKDIVKAGQQIGSVGRTGNIDNPTATKKTDTHLHFEVRYGNTGIAKAQRTTIDPLYYLPME